MVPSAKHRPSLKKSCIGNLFIQTTCFVFASVNCALLHMLSYMLRKINKYRAFCLIINGHSTYDKSTHKNTFPVLNKLNKNKIRKTS